MKLTLLPLLMLATQASPVDAGELLVGNKSDATVWRLDLDDGTRLGAVDTGPGPHEIAMAPGTGVAIVANYGDTTPGNSLTVIDTASGKIARTIDLGEHRRPHGARFLPDGRRALVTTEGSASLLLVDVAAGRVERAIDVGGGGGHMVALSGDGDTAFVSKIAAGTVVRVDLGSGETLEKPAGAGAEGIAVHADGSVWVTNREDGSVTVHDPDTLEIRHVLPSEGFPIRVAFTADGRHALVTNARAGNLAVFDTATHERIATVELAEAGREYEDTMLGKAALPIGVVVDPDEPRAYVAISGADQIAVVDTREWRVVERWPTGDEPDAMAIVPGAQD